MGLFVYATDSYEVEDRALAHLQVVIIDRLRRGEKCTLRLEAGRGQSVELWLTPAVPLEFVYWGNRNPRLNTAWVEQLALIASTVDGLSVLPEPPERE